MKILHKPVFYYGLVLLGIITLFTLILNGTIIIILLILKLNQPWRLYGWADCILIFLIFGLFWWWLQGRFFHVNPSASFAFPWDVGPWLHFTENPQTSMTITWITKEQEPTLLEFGLSHEKLNVVTDKSSKLHRITLNNLVPNTTYLYRICNFPHNPQIHHFSTAPIKTDSIRFVVTGDTQNGGGDKTENWAYPSLINVITNKTAQLFLHTGDFQDQGNDLKSWRVSLETSEKVATNIPMHVVVGNHDTGSNYLKDPTSKKKFPDEGANFDYFFGYKYESPADEDEITSFRGRYYSLRYGNCLFLFIDTQNSKMAEPRNHQWHWIEQTLQNSPKNIWKIAVLHRNLLSARVNPEGGYYYKKDRFAQYLLPLFEKGGIDVVFQGHDHDLEVIEHNIGIHPILLVTSGGGGNSIRCNPPLLPETVKLPGFQLFENSSHVLWVEIQNNHMHLEARYPNDQILWQKDFDKKE